ncbi:hypothetical protein [Bosea sp. UNC402CLCol]|uniref:hypothetical protein n=1 Tax=Bosea sp. UNC402CLCol TaxID=1510531 RepID=UPI0020C0A818|nr:hypothetical protein [Bosea sp. UNC402CLCol]
MRLVIASVQIAAEDLLDHRPGVVRAGEILVDELHRLHEIARQCDLDLLEAARAELAAERDHAALARLRPFGHLRDRHGGQVIATGPIHRANPCDGPRASWWRPPAGPASG